MVKSKLHTPWEAAGRCALIILVLSIFLYRPAWSYTQWTHQVLTETAVTNSVLPSSTLLQALQCAGNTSCTLTYVANVMGTAAINEDNGVRPFAHFFNVQHGGAAMTLNITSNLVAVPYLASIACYGLEALTGASTVSLVSPCTIVGPASSETWALTGLGQSLSIYQGPQTLSIPSQPIALSIPLNFPPPNDCGSSQALFACDYSAAKSAYYNSVTAANVRDRNAAALALFGNLGHVLHLVQDMAQPQHVRNDIHCDALFCTALSLLGVRGFGAPSDYEAYAEAAVVPNGGFSFSSLAATGPQGPLNVLPTPAFISPNQFFATGTEFRGIAQFTSDNFLSVGTGGSSTIAAGGSVAFNPDSKYPLPNYTSAKTMSLIPQCSVAGNSGIGGPNAPYEYVVGSIVDGEKAGPASSGFDQSYQDIPIAALSVIQASGLVSTWPVTQDCTTYDQALYLLVPQAIRYSSWFIDYTFRGSFSALLNPGGKIVITNLTATKEELSNGTFALYSDDASGTRTQFWSSANGDCTSTTLAANKSMTCTGITPPSSVPPSGNYLLVYSGNIGSETGQVAVATVAATATPPNIAGTYQLVSYSGIGVPGVSGGYLITSGSMIFGALSNGSGSWSYSVLGSPLNNPGPPEEIAGIGGSYQLDPNTPFLTKPIEFDSGPDCPKLGDYLGPNGWCAEFPTGGWLFDQFFSGESTYPLLPNCDSGCVEALDSSGNTLLSIYGGGIWGRVSQ